METLNHAERQRLASALDVEEMTVVESEALQREAERASEAILQPGPRQP